MIFNFQSIVRSCISVTRGYTNELIECLSERLVLFHIGETGILCFTHLLNSTHLPTLLKTEWALFITFFTSISYNSPINKTVDYVSLRILASACFK